MKEAPGKTIRNFVRPVPALLLGAFLRLNQLKMARAMVTAAMAMPSGNTFSSELRSTTSPRNVTPSRTTVTLTRSRLRSIRSCTRIHFGTGIESSIKS